MRRFLPVLTIVLALGGCENWNNTPAPDYRIGLVQGPDGKLIAVPPTCPAWPTHELGTLQNDAWTNFGCANARNLAAMARPEDLAKGRPMGLANAETTSAAMERYITGKTTALIDPNATSPSAAAVNSTSGASSTGAATAAGVGGPAAP